MKGEKMLARPPKVRTVKGDGNCFFRAMAVGITRWEAGPPENPSASV